MEHYNQYAKLIDETLRKGAHIGSTFREEPVQLPINSIDGMEVKVEIGLCSLHGLSTPVEQRGYRASFHINSYITEVVRIYDDGEVGYKAGPSILYSSYTIYKSVEQDFEGIGEESLASCIKKFIDTIPLLKFDKFTGRFTLNGYSGELMKHVFAPVLQAQNVKCSMGDCSVCSELTETKPCCGCSGFLCIPCWAQIRLTNHKSYEDDNDDNDDVLTKCPLCRKAISD